MGGLFNVENPFWTFVGKLSDAMLLGAIWLLCSITIIGFGPATTALYYVSFKMVRNEENYVFKMFWKSFKENFRQAAIIGVINLILALLIVYDLWVYYNQDTKLSAYLFVLFLVFAFIWIIGSIYIFAILSKFANSIKVMYVMAFALSIKHFGTTLICLAIFVACAAATIVIFPLVVFIGGACIFFMAYPLRRVMDIYTQKILDRQAANASETSETPKSSEELPEDPSGDEAPEAEEVDSTSEPWDDVPEEDTPAGDEENN